jgi:hypothetical protein
VTQVLGEFASSAEDMVIPLSWVEAAVERWHAWKDSGVSPPMTCVGVDVARGGADRTVLATRAATVITELRDYGYADTMAPTGTVAGVLRANNCYAVVDVIGVGAGVVDRLREEAFNVVAFNAGAGTSVLDISGELGFVNCVTGDTRVAPVGRQLNIYRSRHNGPLLRVKLSSGDEFTVTPNHNVLTPLGWKSVQSLGLGDKLCCPVSGQWMTSGNPHVRGVPPKIGDLYRTASKFVAPERIPGSAVNFHGDRPIGEVEVVALDRKLFATGPTGRQHVAQSDLIGLLHSERALSGQRRRSHAVGILDGDRLDRHRLEPSMRPSRGLAPTIFGGSLRGPEAIGFRKRTESNAAVFKNVTNTAVRDSKVLAELLDGNTAVVQGNHRGSVDDAHLKFNRFGLAAWLDAAFAKDAADDVPVGSEALAQRVKRLARDISFDHIVSIDVIPAGHGDPFVYTMETSTGAYYTSNAVHRNCRSAAWWAMREFLDPANDPQVALPPNEYLISDLTAPRWRVTSTGKIAVESKDDIKKRIGRSTDFADAVIQAFYLPPPEPQAMHVVYEDEDGFMGRY